MAGRGLAIEGPGIGEQNGADADRTERASGPVTLAQPSRIPAADAREVGVGGQGGHRLGTIWGWETAPRMLDEAGLQDSVRRVLPHDPMNAWFVLHQD